MTTDRLARALAAAPRHVREQIEAAQADATAQAVATGHPWIDDDERAISAVAAADPRPCPHLAQIRAAAAWGSQVTWALLDARRLVCSRCSQSRWRPVVAGCSWCRSPALDGTSQAVAVLGATVLLGGAGHGCCLPHAEGAGTQAPAPPT